MFRRLSQEIATAFRHAKAALGFAQKMEYSRADRFFSTYSELVQTVQFYYNKSARSPIRCKVINTSTLRFCNLLASGSNEVRTSLRRWKRRSRISNWTKATKNTVAPDLPKKIAAA